VDRGITDRFDRVRAAAILVATLLAAGCGDDDPAGRLASATTFTVGAAKRDISPTLMTAPPSGNVFLGGYGLGPGRRSTGVLAPIYVRALVISNGEQTVAFAENETQGAFAAYKKGPVGLIDVAAGVETATGGQIPRQHVIVSSDHSHSGPDTTGVWGGLPLTYLTFLRDQMVGAIADAYAARRPAQLLSGTADATALLHSQFDAPPNDQVDGELRVLVVADADAAARRRSVVINFAAHATVMGEGNTLISADWPGAVAARVEQALGVETAVVMVADVGRTQPTRPEVPGQSDPQQLDAYAGEVTAQVLAATAQLQPAHGTRVEAAQLFLRETFANPFADLSFFRSLIARSKDPPWLEGDQIGAVVSAARVGDLFFAAVPGEAYPAIHFALRERVPAARHFIFGLANDQLGYLIAPAEGYQQVADAAPNNDNALFNVSPAIGDHVMCTLFTAARRIGFTLPTDPSKCAPYAHEDNRLPL
jgi:neutral/alkaline ceramidase-like enzyme